MSEQQRQDPLDEWLASAEWFIGEVVVNRQTAETFTLCHRDDQARVDLIIYKKADAALEIARFDDADVYRPLKTAPNLRHGWRLALADETQVRKALDYFYPGRLAAYRAWRTERVAVTPLRETLGRQTGMYRVANKISDEQADDLVAGFCRSDGGCLRTIQWTQNDAGRPASRQLPASKFDPGFDQTGRQQRALPLICQEACNLVVAKAREVVKGAE